MRKINEIIVHCAATPEGKDFTVEDITRWHRKRGFRTIGYHYVIYRDGSVHPGRPIEEVGAHCTGHNSHSIGVCYIGGCTADGKHAKDTRTEAQKAALLSLLKDLHSRFPKAEIHGHREFAAKACPSFDAYKEYKHLTKVIVLLCIALFCSSCRSSKKALVEEETFAMKQASANASTSYSYDRFLQSLLLRIDSIVITMPSLGVSRGDSIEQDTLVGVDGGSLRANGTDAPLKTVPLAASFPLSLGSPPLNRGGGKILIAGLSLNQVSESDKSEVKHQNDTLSTDVQKNKHQEKETVRQPSWRWCLSVMAIVAILMAAIALYAKKRMKA